MRFFLNRTETYVAINDGVMRERVAKSDGAYYSMRTQLTRGCPTSYSRSKQSMTQGNVRRDDTIWELGIALGIGNSAWLTK